MSFIACLVTCHPLPLLFSLPSLCLYCPTLPLLFCFAHFQPLVTRCLVFLQIFDIHNGLPQSGRGPSQVGYLSGPWIARYDFGACSAWYIREEPWSRQPLPFLCLPRVCVNSQGSLWPAPPCSALWLGCCSAHYVTFFAALQLAHVELIVNSAPPPSPVDDISLASLCHRAQSTMPPSVDPGS